MSDVPSTFAEKVRKYYDLPKEERKQRREKLRKCLRSIVGQEEEEAPPDDFFDDVFEVLAKDDDPPPPEKSGEEDQRSKNKKVTDDLMECIVLSMIQKEITKPTECFKLIKMRKGVNAPVRHYRGYDIMTDKVVEIPARSSVVIDFGWILADNETDCQYMIINPKKYTVHERADCLNVKTKMIDSHSDPRDYFVEVENKSSKPVLLEPQYNVAFLVPMDSNKKLHHPMFVNSDMDD